MSDAKDSDAVENVCPEVAVGPARPEGGHRQARSRNVFSFVRHRPKSSLLVGAGGMALFGLVVYYWSYADFWAAQRALQLDLIAEAKQKLDVYLHRHPGDVQARLLAARVCRLLGSSPDAAKHLEECKRLDNGMSAAVQLEWLLLRARQGDLKSVEPALHYALKHEPDQSSRILVLEGLALSYMAELRFRAGAACLGKWLSEEPGSVRALAWRGWARESLGANDEAKKDYQRVLELCPEHVTTRIRLAHLLLAGRDTPQAAEHLKFLEQLAPNEPEVITLLAHLRILEGRNEQARDLLDKFLAREPKNVRALYLRGQTATDPSDRERWLRKALAVDASSSDTYYALYLCLSQQPGRRKEAAVLKKTYETTLKDWESLKDVLNALERQPNNPDLLAKVGKLLLSRDPGTGQEFLYRALNLVPDHVPSHEILASFFETHADPDKAAYHRKAASAKTNP